MKILRRLLTQFRRTDQALPAFDGSAAGVILMMPSFRKAGPWCRWSGCPGRSPGRCCCTRIRRENIYKPLPDMDHPWGHFTCLWGIWNLYKPFLKNWVGLLAIKFGFQDNTLIGKITNACCHLVVTVTTFWQQKWVKSDIADRKQFRNELLRTKLSVWWGTYHFEAIELE